MSAKLYAHSTMPGKYSLADFYVRHNTKQTRIGGMVIHRLKTINDLLGTANCASCIEQPSPYQPAVDRDCIVLIKSKAYNRRRMTSNKPQSTVPRAYLALSVSLLSIDMPHHILLHSQITTTFPLRSPQGISISITHLRSCCSWDSRAAKLAGHRTGAFLAVLRLQLGSGSRTSLQPFIPHSDPPEALFYLAFASLRHHFQSNGFQRFFQQRQQWLLTLQFKALQHLSQWI